MHAPNEKVQKALEGKVTVGVRKGTPRKREGRAGSAAHGSFSLSKVNRGAD